MTTSKRSFLALGRRLHRASMKMKREARYEDARELNKRFWLWVERSPGRPLGSCREEEEQP